MIGVRPLLFIPFTLLCRNMKEEITYIYGHNPVMEALQARPDVVQEVFLKPNSKDEHLKSVLEKLGREALVLNERRLPGKLENDVVHQGVVASIKIEKLMPAYKDFIDKLVVTDSTSILILGEIQDPQNVGAVIRSAAAFGVAAVLVPTHNQAPINGTVVKVSAGMAFRVPLVTINNVNATIKDLKDRGFWVYGLHGEGEVSLPDEKFEKASAFIIGNEGAGLRKITAETCDTLLSIPTDKRCESLNASASVAVVLYDWSTKITPDSQ
ncbi:23S rRNA (guanosine(2251)-2'-O)-methyltransferase RlmB [Candidatus Kaiserbacteria bacterium]|nr:MAG: 23S rRNA (guanosine(2251)-2'-O)-methyltransferase RlmB [Candidatus Kaiserbacteria bacterium]